MNSPPHFAEGELAAAVSAALGWSMNLPLACTFESVFIPFGLGTRGIWGSEAMDWSIVLKVFDQAGQGDQHWRSGADPAHWYYWRREALASSSGLTSSFRGQAARRPVCYLAAGAQIETCISGWETSAGIQPQAISALAARHD